MILMHRVALGGVQLDSVDSRIMVKSVATQAPRENPLTAQRAGDGLRYIRTKRESLDVDVRIGLRIYDDEMDDREELMEQVCAWAKQLPGWLTTSQKPGRRLWVESVKTPAPGDPADWTNEFTFTFTAQSCPWWEDSDATTLTLAQDDEGSGTLTMPGSTETVMEATIQNKSGSTINTLTLSTGNSSMAFTTGQQCLPDDRPRPGERRDGAAGADRRDEQDALHERKRRTDPEAGSEHRQLHSRR